MVYRQMFRMDGTSSCCSWDGCNKNLETSKQDPPPMQIQQSSKYKTVETGGPTMCRRRLVIVSRLGFYLNCFHGTYAQAVFCSRHKKRAILMKKKIFVEVRCLILCNGNYKTCFKLPGNHSSFQKSQQLGHKRTA